MQVVYERCCGLDVHKKSVVACAITPEGKEIKTFGTTTKEILALLDWVSAKGCTHVAMESTGVYWKPIYNLLEQAEITALVVNAAHIKAVPGRKTDVKDAEWIADLLRHGLLQGSYIPGRPQRELRELVRYRQSLVGERAREVQRIQKVLEGANIKLSSVASDVLGVSGRAMLEAIVNGIDHPETLANMAKGRLKKKHEELVDSLQGLLSDHQRMMLELQLRHIDSLDEAIARLNKEIEDRLRPFKGEIELLDTIPGVGRQAAEEIIAEIGVDMSRFPSSAHLASWAGMAPGNNESAGKRKSGRTRKGNKSLRTTLTEAARAAAHTKDTYLSAQYHRIASRRGANRAAVAVGHSILVSAYHILKTGKPYQELGANYFDQRRKKIVVNNMIKRLNSLGFKVTIEAA
ncbi:IS110 family transposase [Thermogutta sp.]|uniref:IS110 family transposase n=1 Tax=Thermogutta sp. TaxID=1962930 RepID=UPI0032205AAA